MPPSNLFGLAGVVLAAWVQYGATQSGSNILDFVDPLIGTSMGGHVFAGATLPFGMAKAVADSTFDGQGGFATDGGSISGCVRPEPHQINANRY